MNVHLLIESIVRQTTVLIAQLATSGGVLHRQLTTLARSQQSLREENAQMRKELARMREELRRR